MRTRRCPLGPGQIGVYEFATGVYTVDPTVTLRYAYEKLAEALEAGDGGVSRGCSWEPRLWLVEPVQQVTVGVDDEQRGVG